MTLTEWLTRTFVGTALPLTAALALSGCGLPQNLPRHDDPFIESPETAIAQQAPRTARATPPARRDPAVARPGFENPGTRTLQPAGYEEPARQPRGRAPIPDSAIQRTSAEARVPLACPPDPCEPGYPAEPGCLPCLADPGGEASDEYLCDGGDRAHPVHYEAGRMAGLNTEDTVAEFRDSRGKRRVLPTNAVCVYSPRFAAVTAVTEPNQNVRSDFLVSSKGAAESGDLRTRITTSDHDQVDVALRLDTRKRGSELFNEDVRDELHNRVRAVSHDQTLIAYDDFTYVRTGVLINTEEAVLATGIQGALDWTRTQFPIIQAHAAGVGEIKAEFHGSELVGRDPPDKPGRLRIVKLVDRDHAAPGEVLLFTIRYDNLGELPLSDVAIIDNLTPRLEYVPDSAESDLAGELTVDDNGEGSQVLRWTLAEPLAGRTGGVATFKAKVR